jgi:hypothetical protein
MQFKITFFIHQHLSINIKHNGRKHSYTGKKGIDKYLRMNESSVNSIEKEDFPVVYDSLKRRADIGLILCQTNMMYVCED